jgi:hypothetical protein
MSLNTMAPWLHVLYFSMISTFLCSFYKAFSDFFSNASANLTCWTNIDVNIVYRLGISTVKKLRKLEKKSWSIIKVWQVIDILLFCLVVYLCNQFWATIGPPGKRNLWLGVILFFLLGCLFRNLVSSGHIENEWFIFLLLYFECPSISLSLSLLSCIFFHYFSWKIPTGLSLG